MTWVTPCSARGPVGRVESDHDNRSSFTPWPVQCSSVSCSFGSSCRCSSRVSASGDPGALVVDAADQSIFQAFGYDPRRATRATTRRWTSTTWRSPTCRRCGTGRSRLAFEVARFLYFYRLVGVRRSSSRPSAWLLLVFPNTFEYFFIAYEVVRTRRDPLRYSLRFWVGMAAAIWIFVKLPQEWWIHIAQLDFTDFMADYPFMWGVLLAVAMIVAIVIWTQRKRIPQPDWPFTVNVDRHLPPSR